MTPMGMQIFCFIYDDPNFKQKNIGTFLPLCSFQVVLTVGLTLHFFSHDESHPTIDVRDEASWVSAENPRVGLEIVTDLKLLKTRRDTRLNSRVQFSRSSNAQKS